MVEVVAAQPHERDAVENLLQLYIHDFSEQWWDRPEGELGDDGRFRDSSAASWWDGEREPLLIRAGGRLAGFVLLNRTGHTARPVDRNVAEFFVVRKHRRAGVGLVAAHTIFSRHPGSWEAAVARRNTGALAFWRRAVAAHPQVHEVEEIDVSDAHWNGPVLRFRIGSRT